MSERLRPPVRTGSSSNAVRPRKSKCCGSVRVRVSGLVLLVGSFLALRVEALTASAGRPVVRVAHEEAAARDALGIIDARAVEVVLAVPVDEDLESVDLDDLVVLVDLPVEGKAVAEAGTAAARDVHPEIRVLDRAQWLAGLGIGPLDELLDFVRCGFRQGHLNHCATPHPRNTMTPLFNHLVASCATPSRSGGSLEELPHVPTLRAESEALVDMACPGVRLGYLEFDFSIATLPGPVARPLDEEFPDAFATSCRRDPDIVDETLSLRRHETAFAEDQIAEEFVGRRLGNPPLRAVPRHVRFDLLAEMGLPLLAVEARPFVRGNIVPNGLQRGSPHNLVIRPPGPSHVDVHGKPLFATPFPGE